MVEGMGAYRPVRSFNESHVSPIVSETSFCCCCIDSSVLMHRNDIQLCEGCEGMFWYELHALTSNR